MSFDGLAVRAVTDELRERFVGGRIDKIQQPDNYTLILTIHAQGKNEKLLLSCNPQAARLAVSRSSKPSPMQPPLFCMVMRKHMEGSKITDIHQLGWERIVEIVCEGYDEMGEKATRVLIGEFMGKHSNLILINPQNNVILDSARRLNSEMSQYRQVLPGLTYIAPPPQEKQDFMTITEEEFIAYMMEAPSTQNLKKVLLNLFQGFGPQTAAELVVRAGLQPNDTINFLGQYDYDRLWEQILWLRNVVQNQSWEAVIVEKGRNAIAFAPFRLMQFEAHSEDASNGSAPVQKVLSSMSELLETFIGRQEAQQQLNQRAGDLDRLIHREIERCEKKLALQLEKVQEGEDAEHLKIWGELITANLWQLKQGDTAEVINYYDENQSTISIPMQPNLTPNENAQKYFRKYARAKSGAEQSLVQADLTQDELNYLDSIRNSLANAQSLQDLQDVRMELETAGYVKAKVTKQNRKSKKEPEFHPLVLHYGELEVVVGKNNVQNDYVTTRLGRNNDVWFHVKDIPGSHVLIRNHQAQQQLGQDVLDFAAHLAAYFSKSRNSALVPVDYTLKRFVHKPNGAKPGRVIFENQKTIYITPDEEAILKILEDGGVNP